VLPSTAPAGKGDNRLAGRLGDLERNRTSGLLLNDGGAVAERPAGRDVADSEFHQITAPQLGVDRTVEEGEISNASLP
jgi:hypothetical protein